MQRHISWVTPEEKELEEKLFAEYSPDNVRTHLEYLTTLKRWAGSEDELKAARYIKETLDSSGVDSEIYDVDAYISHPKEASLEILSPVQKSLPCLPRIFVTPTPPEGIEAELVSVGKGSEKDFQAVDVKGKIVLIPGDRLSRRYVAPVAREKGALAQIHITPGTLRVINYGGIRNTWGSPTLETFDKEPKTTAIAICNEDGDYLEALTKQGPVVVRLKADSWSGYTTIRLPAAPIEGAREPEKFVLVAGHYCSWFNGATDNAAANSLMLEMARLFSKHRKHLGRSIRFAWWPGHEQGTYAGSTWYLDTFWDDIRDNATGYVAMDAIGRVGSLGFESKNTEEIRAFREHVIKEVLGVQVKSTRAPKSGDQSFWKMGLPSCILERTFTAEQTRTIEVDPVWYSHTAEDTLDKVDMEVIMPTFKVTATSILRLCNNPILPFDFAAVAGLLKNTLNALQKGSKSVLDLTSVIDQAEVLEKNVATLTKGIEKILGAYEQKGSDASLEGKVKDINTCLMGLGRTLMPVLSSKAGRYGQDPMGIKFKPLPTLQSLEGLTSMDSDSEEYRALRTSLLRERNRVSDALDWANWILCETIEKTL